jgi:hypothetical protein
LSICGIHCGCVTAGIFDRRIALYTIARLFLVVGQHSFGVNSKDRFWHRAVMQGCLWLIFKKWTGGGMGDTSRMTKGRLVPLLLMERHGICIINVLLIVLNMSVLWYMFPLILNAVDNVTELENMSESMGVILIGYGVAVEERHSFMQIFGLYPMYSSKIQDRVDYVCHAYGLFYLLLGLFMEICVACTKMPKAVINTDDVENIVFATSAVFLTWSSILMLRHCCHLLRAKTYCLTAE